jgi:hypothetical protein
MEDENPGLGCVVALLIMFVVYGLLATIWLAS